MENDRKDIENQISLLVKTILLASKNNEKELRDKIELNDKELRDKISDLKLNLKDLENQNKDLENQNKELRNEISDLKLIIKDLEKNRNFDLESWKKDLKDKLNNLELFKKEFDDHNHRINLLEGKVLQLGDSVNKDNKSNLSGVSSVKSESKFTEEELIEELNYYVVNYNRKNKTNIINKTIGYIDDGKNIEEDLFTIIARIVHNGKLTSDISDSLSDKEKKFYKNFRDCINKKNKKDSL